MTSPHRHRMHIALAVREAGVNCKENPRLLFYTRIKGSAMASVLVRSAIMNVLARQDLFIEDKSAKVIERYGEKLLEGKTVLVNDF